jgi:hypothetical protein
MDINCTNKCVYQIDGKCKLDRLTQMDSLNTYTYNEGCPYCLSDKM